MMNFLAKSLVVLHTVMSLMALAWASMLLIQARDFGWTEPAKEVLDPKAGTSVRIASEYDRSVAALNAAAKTRNLTYAYVKPAIDSMRATEPYLANNHRHYKTELLRLQEAQGKIAIHRLQKGGIVLNTQGSNLGVPVAEEKAVEMVNKSFATYVADLKKIKGEIDVVQDEIRKIVTTTKRITADMTGKDEGGNYVQPGLYDLADKEFKNQLELRKEIDDIKPHWSGELEKARLYQIRRADLEATLQKLKAPMEPAKKK